MTICKHKKKMRRYVKVANREISCDVKDVTGSEQCRESGFAVTGGQH
jgi:hypothetical protein